MGASGRGRAGEPGSPAPTTNERARRARTAPRAEAHTALAPLEAASSEFLPATDGRLPGRRGRATRRKLLEATYELLKTTPFRSITVIDIAKRAGTSPATFYQYFENVEQAILVIAEQLVTGAGALAELVEGDWGEGEALATARRVIEGFMAYWEENRPVFRVVDLATEEGDLRFRGIRVRALNALTVTLSRVIATSPGGKAAGNDPMAVAGALVSMLAHVAAHRYGFEFWGIRTSALVETLSRFLHFAVTGRPAPPDDPRHEPAPPRTGPVLGGGAAVARVESARRSRRRSTA
jgi:AcrR family transcriptional regulator